MGKRHKAKKQQREVYHYQTTQKPAVAAQPNMHMQTAVPVTQQSQYYGGLGTYKNCHNGPIEVFTIGTSKIYAGSQWEIDDSSIHVDLFLCANGKKGEFSSQITIKDERNLLASTSAEVTEHFAPTFLTFDIPDGGVPHVGPRFWKCLVSDIRDKQLSVAVYCQGGHGRTGLILACLAYFGGIVRPPDDVVQYVRGVYCSEAVETRTQLNYLRQLGATTEAQPSFRLGQPALAATHAPITPPVLPGVKEGIAGAATVVNEVPASERQTTVEELVEWEKELILEEEQKQRTRELNGSGSVWNDYINDSDLSI